MSRGLLAALAVLVSCARPDPAPALPPQPFPIEARKDPPKAPPGEPIPIERITLEVRAAGARFPPDAGALRRAVVWRGGKTELPRGYGMVGLPVHHVVEGKFEGSHAAVLLLGEAAHVAPGGMDGLDGFEGTWTVQRLPDGSLVVDDIEDTPFARSTVAHRDALRAKIADGLASDDPTYQTLALATLSEHQMLEFVPQVAALLDSQQVATARPWLTERHGSVGKLAALTLRYLTDPIADADTPLLDARAERHTAAEGAAWQAWWRDMLAAEPFPQVETLAPPMTALAVLNDPSPEVFADPRGDRVVVAGAKHGRNGSGHALLDRSASTSAWLRGPAEGWTGPVIEPRSVAWTPARAGILAGTWDRMPTVLIVSERDGSLAEHNLHGYKARHAAIAPRGDGWLLAYTTGPQHSYESGRRALWLQPLTANGRRDGRRVRVELPEPPRNDLPFARSVKVEATSEGFAVAVQTNDAIVVVGLDVDLRQHWTRRFEDARAPELAAADGRLLVQWTRRARGGDGILAASMTAAGVDLWSESDISGGVRTATQPAPTPNGWVFGWVGDGKMGPEIQARYVSAKGEAEEVRAVAQVNGVGALTISVSSEEIVFLCAEAQALRRLLVRRVVRLPLLRGT